MESFWSTEYGQDIMSMENTPIDRLLSSPDTVLEDLMDDDELLQQCSNKNGALIDFLSKEENITKLISYITRPWQEHMTRIVQHLTEQEALAEQKQQSNPDSTTQINATSPLSGHGIHSITTIKEEDGDPQSAETMAESLTNLEITDPSPSTVRVVLYCFTALLLFLLSLQLSFEPIHMK